MHHFLSAPLSSLRTHQSILIASACIHSDFRRKQGGQGGQPDQRGQGVIPIVCKDPSILLLTPLIWYTCSASPHHAESGAHTGAHRTAVKSKFTIPYWSPRTYYSIPYTGVIPPSDFGEKEYRSGKKFMYQQCSQPDFLTFRRLWACIHSDFRRVAPLRR